eukprot:7215581-Pyramimonas_sp.AAC.1
MPRARCSCSNQSAAAIPAQSSASTEGWRKRSASPGTACPRYPSTERIPCTSVAMTTKAQEGGPGMSPFAAPPGPSA